VGRAEEEEKLMLDRLTKSPLLLGAAFIVSALLGAGAFALIQSVIPSTGGDRAKTEAMIHDYILDHGELLPEAMDRLATKSASKAVAANRAGIVDPYPGAFQGNPKGDVTVAAYLDYNCGYCRASLPAIAQLVARDPNVRIVYREFPVLADSSVTGARWALAAAEQGKFLAFHKALYAAGRSDDASIAAAAAAAQLDQALAAKTIQEPRVTAEITKNHKIAEQLGSSGATPFWVVGDKVIQGMLDYDKLAAAVAQARKGK
jgi:protein-disulfide isomerase